MIRNMLMKVSMVMIKVVMMMMMMMNICSGRWGL